MLILTAACFAIATAAAWRGLAPLHPAQLWLTVWTLALGLVALHLLPYAPLAGRTFALITTSSLAFIAASCLASRFLRAPRGPSALGPREVELAAAGLLAIALLGCALFLAQAMLNIGIRDTLLTSQVLRGPVQDGHYALTIKYLYFALAAAALCGVAAGVAPTRRGLWLAASGAAVMCTYFATGRATVVVAGLAAAVGFLVAAGTRFRLRRALLGTAAAGLVSLAVFSVMGQLIGKTYENSDLVTVRSFFSEHPRAGALATPYMYVSAPIGALNALVLNPPADRSDGCAMLSVICTVASHAGVDARATKPIRPFTAKPIPWNTYTALDDGIRDVGMNNVPIVFALLGLLCGWLWACARRGRPWGIAAYAVMSTAILGSAGSNTFGASLVIGAIMILLVSLAAAMVLRTLMSRR